MLSGYSYWVSRLFQRVNSRQVRRVRQQLVEGDVLQVFIDLARVAVERCAHRAGARDVRPTDGSGAVRTNRGLRCKTFEKIQRAGEVAQQPVLGCVVLNLPHQTDRIANVLGAGTDLVKR